ncbi:hypothetical protein ABIA32_006559 [Streptacidiphilus sp. MAP12-20]
MTKVVGYDMSGLAAQQVYESAGVSPRCTSSW